MRKTTTIAVAAAALSGALLAAGCGGGTNSSGGSTGGTDWSKATSVAQGGGMTALIAAAKKEGQLNVITLPANWANYGNIMKDFTAKYGIKINDANPDGSSQDEINAMVQLKGQTRAPDVLDMGTAFAIKADQMKLLAKYEVAAWNDIPAAEKSTDGTNGGSLGNINPGIAFFAKLKKKGNFVPVTAGPTTVQSGQTPIVVSWDYLLASEVGATLPNFKIVIPSDASYAAYYDQAISADAPDPAAARLWEEYLYSVTGQNLWLQGKARPVELPTMIANGTVDKAANAALPPAPSAPLQFPTQAQESAAEGVVAKRWAARVG